MSNLLRNIPSVNELLESPPIRDLLGQFHRSAVVTNVRSFLTNLRNEVQSAAGELKLPNPSELAQHIAQFIVREQKRSLRPVINATGILLHTGLGRAPLAREAIDAILEVAGGYASVEVDLETGERSQRVLAVEKLLTQLTGAEAAIVVNNNAGATLLTLVALAQGKEVVVSRGQLIEIGGSYRLPDVMLSSGAVLREVGTTNKTRIEDFERAIVDRTAALLKVHTSNYIVVGFTEQPTLAELVTLARRHGIPLIDDIGSGALIDFSKYGLDGEPVAAESIHAGADLVLFSGDKLLGGPQCGIIVGKRSLIKTITQHPLMRALRVDKLTLAGLAATLRLYQDPEVAERSVPLLAMLATPLDNLKNRAERLAPQLAAVGTIAQAEAIPDVTYLGGGAVPTQQIRTWCVAVRPADHSVDQFAAMLRQGQPAVFGRVQKDRLLFDLRSVSPDEDAKLVAAVNNTIRGLGETATPPV